MNPIRQYLIHPRKLGERVECKGGGLPFSVDQETGITRIERNQVAVRIAGRVESIAGATQRTAVLIPNDRRFVTETAGD